MKTDLVFQLNISLVGFPFQILQWNTLKALTTLHLYYSAPHSKTSSTYHCCPTQHYSYEQRDKLVGNSSFLNLRQYSSMTTQNIAESVVSSTELHCCLYIPSESWNWAVTAGCQIQCGTLFWHHTMVGCFWFGFVLFFFPYSKRGEDKQVLLF